jgi:hypothetical protein
MNAPIAPAATEKSLSVESIVEAEISNLVTQLAKQDSPKLSPQIESHAERIRSSVGRLTVSSISELKGLTTQLEELQEFVKSEVERVERDIESALAGINIIIETIAPWRSITDLPPVGQARRADASADIDETEARAAE